MRDRLPRRHLRTKKVKKKTKKQKRVMYLLTILGIFALAVGAYAYYTLSALNQVEFDKTDEELGIQVTLPEEEEEEVEIPKFEKDRITHIALFGVDAREKGENARSDAIMIGTLDELNGQVKMTSIMRDLYVPIDGQGKTKINHAYAYGGPELAVKTLNQTFGLDIRDYVTVDFYGLSDIIDALGGVTINVKQEEIEQINKYAKEVAVGAGKSYQNIERAGEQTLNGMQAVAYSRIRKVGNGDFERTERQRTVLSAMLQKISDAGTVSLATNASKILPYVETSLSYSEIMDLAYNYFKLDDKTIYSHRYPEDSMYKGGLIGGVYYLQTDLEQLKVRAKTHFYGVQKETELDETNEVVDTGKTE